MGDQDLSGDQKSDANPTKTPGRPAFFFFFLNTDVIQKIDYITKALRGMSYLTVMII